MYVIIAHEKWLNIHTQVHSCVMIIACAVAGTSLSPLLSLSLAPFHVLLNELRFSSLISYPEQRLPRLAVAQRLPRLAAPRLDAVRTEFLPRFCPPPATMC